MKRLGMTLVEVSMAAAIIGVVVLGFSLFQVAAMKSNQHDRERAFALQKAAQIMEELKAKVAADAKTTLVIPANMAEVSGLIASAMRMIETGRTPA